MNTPKWTPGPWAVRDTVSDECGRRIETAYCVPFGDAPYCPHIATASAFHYGQATAKANARLIAAAPELVEALLAMVKHYGGGPVSTAAEGLAAHRKARAALAKLDGKDA